MNLSRQTQFRSSCGVGIRIFTIALGGVPFSCSVGLSISSVAPNRSDQASSGIECLVLGSLLFENLGGRLLMERFVNLEKRGQGSYGVVYRATDTSNGSTVALKTIPTPEDQNNGIPSALVREIGILQSLRLHENVIHLIDVISTNSSTNLVFEFVDYELRALLNENDDLLDDNTVSNYARQLLQGLNFCHHHSIMHRDLKPQNILVSPTGVLKIADFGMARTFLPPLRGDLTKEVTTLWYRSPEILLGCRSYTVAVDMWAAGVVIAELLTKRPLVPGISQIDQIFKIFRLRGT
jgi:serine/threonine protein kinase